MKYMVEIKYPRYKSNSFQSVLPEQQKQIAELMQADVIQCFSLNAEQTRAWFIIAAESRSELDFILDNMVTRPYMLRTQVELLMVHDTRALGFPPLVLN